MKTKTRTTGAGPSTMTPDPTKWRDDPAYLRGLIERARLSQAEVAMCIGVAARTMRRYVNGEAPIPYPVQFAVEVVVASSRAMAVTRQIVDAASPGELRDLQRQLARDVERHAVTSRAYTRARRQLDLIEAETKRRNGN